MDNKLADTIFAMEPDQQFEAYNSPVLSLMSSLAIRNLVFRITFGPVLSFTD